MGRGDRGCCAEPGWDSSAFSVAPSLVAVTGKKRVTGSALPGATAAPAPGDSPELVTVRVREAEQRPLLRSLFRRGLRRCLWWQPGLSPLLSPRRWCQASTRGLLASRFRGGNGLRGILLPISRAEASTRALGQGVEFLHFVFFRSVFGFFLFPLSFLLLFSFWVLPNMTSSLSPCPG